MRGLDPRIHLLRKKVFKRRWMDCRVKPGNDDLNLAPSRCAGIRRKAQAPLQRQELPAEALGEKAQMPLGASSITAMATVPMIGPSTRPMPPITVMKMTKAVQSLTLNAVSGEIRSFCRKIKAPTMAVPKAVKT